MKVADWYTDAGKVRMGMLCLAVGFWGQITVECWDVQKAASSKLVMKHGAGDDLI